jgi:hypothetical protein
MVWLKRLLGVLLVSAAATALCFFTMAYAMLLASHVPGRPQSGPRIAADDLLRSRRIVSPGFGIDTIVKGSSPQ